MSRPAAKLATYDDILDAPEHLVAEILNGQLETHPRPSPKHAYCSSGLGGYLSQTYDHGNFGGPGGWWILDEPELHLGPDVLVPDIAGWRREQMPQLPETAWFDIPPDWVCEVLSPSTAKRDRVVKMPLYASYGVTFLWLVDPMLQTLEAYELQQGHWSLLRTLSENDCVSLPPFSALEFPLSHLWPSSAN